MFAAAAVAGAQNARRREAELALAGMLSDPLPLWHHGLEDFHQPVWLLFVYIHDMNLVPKLANTRLQLRVRYGNNGCYQEKYSQKVRSSTPEGDEQARGVFEAMFVYPWSRTLQPSIMIDLVKLGFIDWTISTGAVSIPFGEGNPGAIDHDVLFFGKKGEDGFIGQLSVFLEVRSISRAELELGIDRLTLSALDMAIASELGGLRPSPMGPMGRMGSLGMLGYPGHGLSPHVGPSVGGTPVVLGHALPRGAPTGGAGVVQGSAVDSAAFAGSFAPGEAVAGLPPNGVTTRPREETSRNRSGQVRHVVVTRNSQGREERLEWTE